jgi:hypothetical protein
LSNKISEQIRERFARRPGQPQRYSENPASGAKQLKRIIQDDFCHKVIDGSMHVLENSSNPIRLNLFSCAIRELFSHVLHAFAPEDAVEACSWFKPESHDGKPTRRQRAIYMAQGGLADTTIGALHGSVRDIHSRVIKAIQALNKYTHMRPGSVITDQKEVDTFATDTFNAFHELFYARKFCHSLIINAMHRRHSKALHGFISRSLATHDEIKDRTDLEPPDIEDFEVQGIGPLFVFFRLEGALNDILRFRIKMKSPVDNLGALRKISVEIGAGEFPAEEC